jgi:hypothetical protein
MKLVVNLDRSEVVNFIGICRSVLKSLWGDNYRDMMKVNFNITLDDKGNFTGVKVGEKSYSISEWNKQFESQSAE